jgi:methylmalonyl-CoA mutase cobalamin-binding domain/chain
MADHDDLAAALASCEEEKALGLLRAGLAAGDSPHDLLGACNRGMIELGNRFGREECFLPDLMFGGMIMKRIMEELGPRLGVAEAVEARATAVMGTVQHDVHDIGKDIVVMMLHGAGFDVIDLGVDVPPQQFAEAVRRHKPAVVGMSLLLTTGFKSVAATVQAIRDAGLRQKVSIMVGGAAASDLLSQNAGCDFYGKTAVDGLDFARRVAGVQ